MPRPSGREREAKMIRQANRAAAVGRLMLGEFNSWQEFLGADVLDLENLPRRQLKSGKTDVKRRLSSEIKSFCTKNFRGMTESKLSLLYEDIKAFRGLEIPLKEFEEKFAHVNPKVLKGNPAHLTLSFSLWGLQFKFPEDELAKDVATSLRLIGQAQEDLEKYKKAKHQSLEKYREKIAALIQQNSFASRSTILFSFNLMEAYLNGLSWDYRHTNDTSHLSNSQRKLLEDKYRNVRFWEKLKKYPQIITGRDLWNVKKNSEYLDAFLNTVQPFRDSLVHPSPFTKSEESVGYDKLQVFYNIHYGTGIGTANLAISLIELIHTHVYGDENLPKWFTELRQAVADVSKTVREIEKRGPSGRRF